MTVYYAAQTLVLGYVKRPSHAEALWFASVSNNILWWTYCKAFWRTLVTSFSAPLAPHEDMRTLRHQHALEGPVTKQLCPLPPSPLGGLCKEKLQRLVEGCL